MEMSETEVSGTTRRLKERYIEDISKAVSQIDSLWILEEIRRLVANITR